MVSLVNSHTNATRIGWHLRGIDLRFAHGLHPEWVGGQAASVPSIAGASVVLAGILQRTKGWSIVVSLSPSTSARVRVSKCRRGRGARVTRGSGIVAGSKRLALALAVSRPFLDESRKKSTNSFRSGWGATAAWIALGFFFAPARWGGAMASYRGTWYIVGGLARAPWELEAALTGSEIDSRFS